MNGNNYENYAKAYMTDVYRMALSCCGNVHDAEDVTQTAFMKLLESDKSFESDEHVKNWLLRVVINESRTLTRSVWKRRVDSLEDAPEPSFTMKERSDLWYAVRELAPKYRMAVHLYYYEDYSVREIAAITGTTESTVQTRLQRARKQLEQKLKGSMA